MVPITLLYNLSSFVIVLHHGCQLFETSVMVAVDKESNVTKQNWWKCRLPLLSTAEAMRQRHESLHGVEKILQHHHMPFCYRTAWMESDIYIFYIRDFCCCCYCFCTASVLHVWNHPYCMYGIIRTACVESQLKGTVWTCDDIAAAVTANIKHTENTVAPCGSDMNWSM